MMTREAEETAAMKPAWLQGLMAETFFAACGAHHSRRKNEKNIFCLICCLSFCPHCLPSHHPSHPLLQMSPHLLLSVKLPCFVCTSQTTPTQFINPQEPSSPINSNLVRRYVYQDVIRLDDLEKIIDCSYIQPYTINSAKVIFLNERAQSKSCKGLSSANTCFTCDRILQDPFHFCSLSCKVDHMVYQGEDISSILYKFDVSDFTSSQLEGLRVDASSDDGQITPNSILEDPLEFGGSSYETGCSESGLVMTRDSKNKRGFLMLSLSSRRKGAPQRSPLS